MRETANLDRFRAILVIFAAIVTVVFNSLAAAGYVNGVRPNEISDRYPTVVTPAGYAFSIWSLIYTGLIALSIYQVLPSQLERFRNLRTPLLASCLLNCAWVYFWHHNQIVICFAIILALFVSLIVLIARTSCSTNVETWFVQAPLGIYAGWVSVASTVNLAIMLVYLNVQMSPTTLNVFATILILFAALVAVIVRIKFRNFFYPLAVAWAVTAVAVKQSGNTPVVVAAAIAVVTCLITAGSFVVHLRDSSNE